MTERNDETQVRQRATDRMAFERIAALCRPGQELTLREAVEILSDVWNVARRQVQR